MRLLIGIFLITSLSISAQDSTSVITLSEYLGYVKTFHPVVKQANLIINESEELDSSLYEDHWFLDYLV